jgi:hypothetical protein
MKLFIVFVCLAAGFRDVQELFEIAGARNTVSAAFHWPFFSV